MKQKAEWDYPDENMTETQKEKYRDQTRLMEAEKERRYNRDNSSMEAHVSRIARLSITVAVAVFALVWFDKGTEAASKAAALTFAFGWLGSTTFTVLEELMKFKKEIYSLMDSKSEWGILDEYVPPKD